MSRGRPAELTPEDVLRHPWRYEHISRAEAAAACPWEPVVAVTRGPGLDLHGVWFYEGHPLHAHSGIPDLQQVRYYRRRDEEAIGSDGGTGAAGAVVDLVREIEKELGVKAPRRESVQEKPKATIGLKLVDADTGEAIQGVRVQILGRDRRLADELTGGSGQVQVPDVPKGSRFSVAFPGLGKKKTRQT